MTKFKQRRFLFNLLLITCSVSFLIYASSTGITGTTKKNGNGCDCHGGFSNNVTVTINGPEVMTVNETATFSVTISGGTLSAGGTNIAASSGVLTAGVGSKKVGDELTHSSPKSPSANIVTFDFTYTAPSTTGNVTLYANGNSVNLNGGSNGDLWNFAPNKVIVVNPVTDIEDESTISTFQLAQNYPNPFNPTTTIAFQIKEAGYATLKVYNLIGKEVATLVNEEKQVGKFEVKFDASNLSSGIYYYRLQSGNFTETKKMILLQ